MKNFSIAFQINKELGDFYKKQLKLAAVTMQDNDSLRYLNRDSSGYFFNQAQTLAIIDLYYNSKFVNGAKDKLGHRKIFMNVGKFRTEVAAKQIDLDTKDGRFVPDQYADPWIALFMQKEFKEWAKDTDFGELLNTCVDSFPKYGTVVLKQYDTNKIKFVPLQTLRNDQTAEDLQTATYVIEEHPKMTRWEVEQMKGWDMGELQLDYDQEIDVYERYGYVPLSWLNQINYRPVQVNDDETYVDAMVICTFDKNAKNMKSTEHVFFAEQIKERPYREAHWNKQYGRWLGLGIMEDLIENQEAKNIIVNLQRRSLQWASRKNFQSSNTDLVGKSLVKDTIDGEIVEVGANGQITPIDFTNKSSGEFNLFLNEWENNANQKAFTFDVMMGTAMPQGTAFRTVAALTQAANSFFQMKRQKLALFLQRTLNDFIIPQFLKDIGNQDKVLNFFHDEPGFEALKEAAMSYVKSEAIRISLLSGKEVDTQTLTNAVNPFDAVKQLFFSRPRKFYETAKHSFEFVFTDESVNINDKIQTLTILYQSMQQAGDTRAPKVLDRILALSGEDSSTFGQSQPMQPQQQAQQPQPKAPQGNGQAKVPTNA